MANHSIIDYGAKLGSDECQTGAVQSAIDSAAAQGGGRVLIPGRATIVVGSLEIRSGVELHVPAGATLAGSPHRSDYREEQVAGEYGAGQSGFLLRADGADRISITGEGTIDQRGSAFADGFKTPEGPYALAWKPWRPRMIGLFGCRDVAIRNVTLTGTANWCVHLLGCDDVDIDQVVIRTPLDGPNCDGICPDHCRRVRIHGCDISSGDDSIVIKTTREGVVRGYNGCHDVEIADCRLTSTSAAVKLGSESQSDIIGVRVRDCQIRSSARGLGIQLRDGGSVRDVVFENIDIETRLFHDQWWGKAEPIYVTVVPRAAGREVGRVEHIRFERIRARSEGGVMLAGSAPGHLEDVVLREVSLSLEKWTKWAGGFQDWRPMLGGEQTGLRAHHISAVFLQHARKARLENVAVNWADDMPDYYRHALEVVGESSMALCEVAGESAHPGKFPARRVAPAEPDGETR